MSTRIAHLCKDTQTWAVLVATALILTACGGGGGSGIGADGPPAAPTAGYVPLSSSNPQNVINQSNQGDLQVWIEFGPESTSNSTVTVTIGDPETGDFATAQAAAPEGQGSAKVGPMNVRAMPDGSYPMIAEVTSPAGSSGEINLGTVLKDTAFYSTSVAASVAALPGGAQPNGTAMSNVINLVNVGGVTVTTVWGDDADDSLSFVVDLTDERGNTVTSGVFSAPEGAGNIDATNIDASGLDEGPVVVMVRVTDAGGNETAFVGTAATKDVIVPVPLTVQVPQGGSNPVDFINAATQTSVTVRAILSSAFTSEETISIELTDGTNTVTADPQPALLPESSNTYELYFTNIDISSLEEGLITLNAHIQDANGNHVSSPGSSPIKDTIIGQASASLVAQGTHNPPGIINIASEDQVYVDVWCDAQTEQGDAVSAHFETSGIQAHSAPASATGPGAVSVGPTDTQVLYDGNVTVWATITDAAGNSWTGATSVADKGTVAPSTPAFVRIASTSTNGVDVINSFNVLSTTVETQVGSGTDASRTITFMASNGSAQVTQTVPAPNAGAAVSFNGLDCSALKEGPLDLRCWATDGFANRSTVVSANPYKDTVSPTPAKSIVVSQGTSNPQGFVNALSATGVLIAVDFPTPYEFGVYWQVVFADSVGGSASSPTFKSPTAGGIESFIIDLSGLADGPLSVTWSASDSAGNPATQAAPNATKDTVAPGAPSSLAVQAGQGNATGVINMHNEAGARVAAAFTSNALGGGELFTITMTPQGSSSPSVSYGPISGGPIGGSSFVFGPMNTTPMPEGIVDVRIDIVDASGNATSYLGTPALKDVTPPATPTSAGVAAGAMNPSNFVNFHNEPSIDVGVDFGSGSVSTDQVWVTLTGGAFNVTAGPLTAPDGTGSLSFAGIDGSLLTDGPVSMQVTVEDVNGNQSIFAGAQAHKDTVAPSPPTSAAVAAGTSNVADSINMTNVDNVVVSVELPDDYKGTEQVTVTLTGGTTASATVLSPIYGGSILVNQIDASALADGTIAISVDVVDPAGNSVNFTGTPCMKDTAPPAAPTSIAIPSGTSNPENVINNQTETAVDVMVDYDNSMTGMETAILHMTGASGDRTSTVLAGPVPVPSGGGMATFSGVNAGRLDDGPISLAITITDAQFNEATFTGTSATKDTVGPLAPLTAHVWETSANPTNFINAASASATQVDVTFDGGSQATDTVTVTLGGLVQSSSMSAPSGSGSLSFTGIDATSLPEGSALVQVSVLDASMNLTTMFGTTARKDTVLPEPYTSAHIVAGAGNAQDIVNTSNAGSARMIFILPNTYAGSEIINASITDTAPTTVSVNGLIAPFTGGGLTVTWPDLSAMLDGTLTVSLTATDPAGNQGTFSLGTNPTKDTTPPMGPSALGIPMSATNPVDFINGQTVAAVACAVMYDGSMDGTEVATLVYAGAALSGDMPIERRFGPFAVPASGGAATISGADLRSFTDGAISISIEIMDVAGNVSVHPGTNATKDTVVPNAVIVDPMPTPVNVTGQDVTGVSEPGDTVEVIVGGAAVATAASDALGSFIINWTVPAGVMTTFEVRATDVAGNPQTLDTAMDWNGAALSVTHDATAPSIPWTDNTVTANLVHTDSVSGGSFIDVDNDGDLDLFVNKTNRLWRNDGAGVYTDVTATLSVNFVGDASATWGDYDGDGDCDLWTTHGTLGSFLWQNDGTGNFTDVTTASGAGVFGALQGTSWLDYNADGWMDLFAVNGDLSGNVLLGNNGTTPSTFTPVSLSPLGTGISAPHWVCVGDLDGNGAMDVVIGDATPSLQYMNDGSGTFNNTAGTGMGQSGFSADTSTTNGGIAMADLDNDGDLDMFVASGGAGGANQFWQNDGTGNFTDVAATAGCDTAANAYDVVIADFDNDGMRDVYLACNGANVLYRNQGDQVGADGIPEFTDVASQVGGMVNDGSDGRLCCAGDVDGDGDMDVFVGNEAVGNVMYQNGLGNNFRYLMVKLVGKGAAMGGSSPDAIGARVRIEDASTGASVMWRWVGSGRGAGADDPKILHFGGITPSRAYHVHVTWTTGATQSLMNVVPTTKTSQTVTIVEQ